MSIICPTILADNPHTYRQQMERVADFAQRIQIDLADGRFAPTITVKPAQLYWSDDLLVDIHLMYDKPLSELETLVSLKPNMVIVHFEADVSFSSLVAELHKYDIKAGLALLKPTGIDQAAGDISLADHVLLFSGDLGYFGGTADMGVLEKVTEIRRLSANMEIGWDGGVNNDNARQLAKGGIDVLNVGGFIQKSDQPKAAYAILNETINS